ncbi:MAG: PQQ-binding-like beta-propeller repeat protein [Aliidongia sp.]
MQKTLAALGGLMIAAAGFMPIAALADDGGRGGEWPMFGNTLQNTAADSSERQIPWHRSAISNRPGSSRPAAMSRRGRRSPTHVAYFPDWGGNLWAVDTKTGEVVWHHLFTDYGLPSGTVARATPAIADGTIYIGTQLGADMLAIDARRARSSGRHSSIHTRRRLSPRRQRCRAA